MTSPKIAVVGAGPVGSILVAYLVRGGHRVVVVDVLKPFLETIRANGLHIEGFTTFHVPIESTYDSIEAASRAGSRFDIVFVCVKAPVNPLIAGALPSIAAEGGAVVAFQNGLDTEAAILAACGPDVTVRGVVNYAGNAAAPGRIHMTFFNGANYLGAAARGNEKATAKARDVAALMSGAQMTTELADDVQRHVWAKAIRNAALMPISALTGMDMAEVMEHSASRHILEAMLDEQLAVAASAGYVFDRKFRDDSLAYFRKAGHHMPSMYDDVVNKRRSEIAFLNHRIAEVGEQHGVPVPYNRAVANLVLCVDEVAVRRKSRP
ncbi:MAG: ketopantoate reductase family protein [Deltaproteobacteria bacterium]|nr:ketopantoate reductase family protein [Deltaproteobacteria bacterium]